MIWEYPTDEAWVEYDGTGIPVPETTVVTTLLRFERQYQEMVKHRAVCAGDLNWSHSKLAFQDKINPRGRTPATDIVAYLVVSP